REVPFAHGVGGVAVGGEHGGQQRARAGDAGVVAGEPARQLHDAAHAAAVVVPAGQHAGPGGAAEAGRVEVGVAEALGGQRVERRRLDVRAEAPQLGEPDVVEHDEQDV